MEIGIGGGGQQEGHPVLRRSKVREKIEIVQAEGNSWELWRLGMTILKKRFDALEKWVYNCKASQGCLVISVLMAYITEQAVDKYVYAID